MSGQIESYLDLTTYCVSDVSKLLYDLQPFLTYRVWMTVAPLRGCLWDPVR